MDGTFVQAEEVLFGVGCVCVICRAFISFAAVFSCSDGLFVSPAALSVCVQGPAWMLDAASLYQHC